MYDTDSSIQIHGKSQEWKKMIRGALGWGQWSVCCSYLYFIYFIFWDFRSYPFAFQTSLRDGCSFANTAMLLHWCWTISSPGSKVRQKALCLMLCWSFTSSSYEYVCQCKKLHYIVFLNPMEMSHSVWHESGYHGTPAIAHSSVSGGSDSSCDVRLFHFRSSFYFFFSVRCCKDLPLSGVFFFDSWRRDVHLVFFIAALG